VNSLGRHPNNTIQLLDKIVSKEHCIIELRNDHYVLRDLGSLNGTYINNERVRGEAPLKNGDEIALGATRGRFEDSPPAAAYRPAWPAPPAAAPVPPPMAPPMQQQAPLSMGAQPPHAMPPHGAPGHLAGQSPLAQSGALPFTPGGQAPPPPAPYYQQQPPPPPPRAASNPSMPPPASMQPVPSTHAAPPAYGGGPPAVGPAGGTTPLGGARSVMAGGPAPVQVASHPPYQPAPPAGHPPHLMTTRGGLPGFFPTPAPQGPDIALSDQERQIGTQIDAVEKGFQAFDRIANDLQKLRADYERLRLSHELSHAIGIERDTTKLLDTILSSVMKFISADRAVIFLRNEAGELQLCASKRRDGSNAPISVSSTILNHVVKERAAVLTHDAAMDFAASKGKSMILNRISSAIVAPLLQHDNEVLGVLWLDSETLARFQAKDLELVQTVCNQAARFIEINILGKKVEVEIVSRERLSRLLSPNIAERVISGELEVKQGGQRVEECTVFNSDIRGFTRMSEGSTPEVLVEMLNEYFELMVDTIFKHEGTLDKFMGDGIMALWGAPVQTPEDAVYSVDCALEMGEVLGQFNRRRMERNEAPLAIGIGIHTGPLVAGYIGSSKALSYTVIGDTANTSARLCSVALAGQVIVSENTLVRLKNRFDVEELQAAKVKGKERPLRIFNVLRRTTKVAVPGNPFAAEPTSAVVPHMSP
jgi:adenylate cyclase